VGLVSARICATWPAKFFKGSQGLLGLLVRFGAGAHMAEPQALQHPIDSVIRDRDAELLLDPLHQIAGPPAHHIVHGGDWALLHQRGQLRLLSSGQLRRRPRRPVIDQPLRAALIEAMHPIAQRLPVHAPIFAAAAREAPSTTAAIDSSRRA